MGAAQFLEQLRHRREEIGMPMVVLARKAGVSMQTLHRMLHGQASVHFDKVLAVAHALDIELTPRPRTSPFQLRKRQARAKARELVGAVQGTSGLEGQGLDRDAVAELTEDATRQLLASNRKLWAF
jgi:transcriptional regulator with XRE-family HTH domain